MLQHMEWLKSLGFVIREHASEEPRLRYFEVELPGKGYWQFRGDGLTFLDALYTIISVQTVNKNELEVNTQGSSNG